MAVAEKQARGVGEYLTVSEISEMLRISEYSIRKQCQRGALPAARFGTKWRVRRADLDAMFSGGLIDR